MSKIECLICHKVFVTLNLHVKVHDLTTKEYMDKFPGTPMASQEFADKIRAKLKGREVTQETREKIASKVKASWAENRFQGRTGIPLSEESKKALSEKLMGHEVSKETRDKISEQCTGNPAWNKGKTKEDDPRIMQLSESLTGRKIDQTIVDKVAESLKKRYANGMQVPHAKNGYRKDLNMSFRSSWEANFARYLIYISKEIIYEKDRFTLKDKNDGTHVYVTDFKMSDCEYIEIKGHADAEDDWTCNCKRCIRDKNKLDLMKTNYPNIQVKIFGKNEYKIFKKEYSKIVLNWEFV